jgi:hypothetical protein
MTNLQISLRTNQRDDDMSMRVIYQRAKRLPKRSVKSRNEKLPHLWSVQGPITPVPLPMEVRKLKGLKRPVCPAGRQSNKLCETQTLPSLSQTEACSISARFLSVITNRVKIFLVLKLTDF